MNSTPITTTVQGGSSSGFPIRWDPVTGFGMPPGFFTSSGTGQGSTSASTPMAHQQNMSASQPMMQNTSATQQTGQNTTSASQPMLQQQSATSIHPVTPTEILVSRLPHQNGVNWVFHDPAVGSVRHVNVPHVHPMAQQSINQSASQPITTSGIVLYQ